MRKLILISALSAFIFILTFSGCDSPTDSKAISVTAPSLSEPADNSSGITRTPNFKWTGSADKLECATNSNFENAISWDVSGSEYTIPTPLNPGTTYFWRAGKKNGTAIVWCEQYWRFTTGN